MSRSRLRGRALGIFIAMLGLIAIGAQAAQAEPGANWRMNGANVVVALLPSLQIGAVENNTLSLLTRVAGVSVTFLCTGEELIGAKLETEGRITAGFKIKLTGCVTLLNGMLSAVCTPFSAGQPLGTVLSNELKGLLVLHEGQGLIRIEPKMGETLKVYEFHEECPLPAIPLKGKLFLKDCKNELRVELVTHLFEQGPLTHLYVISDTAEHAVNFDGSATMILTGAHAGFTWSGQPA